MQVAEDFLNLCDADLEAQNMTESEFDEEVNLIYVALTRTRGILKLPQSLDTWWKSYRKGEQPPRSERMQAKLKRKKGGGDFPAFPFPVGTNVRAQSVSCLTGVCKKDLDSNFRISASAKEVSRVFTI